MEQSPVDVLALPADALPPVFNDWLVAQERDALLISCERLPDGRVVFQTLPDIDPTLVARLRKVLAEYADVLRRLT